MAKKKIDPKIAEVTENDFRAFIAEAEYWVKRFGLTGWETHYELDDIEGLYALTSWDGNNRSVVFTLSMHIPTSEYSDYDIAASAFHEVCELLLNKVHRYTEYYHISEDVVIEDAHEIIRILENSVFSPDWHFRRYGVHEFSPERSPKVYVYGGAEDKADREVAQGMYGGVGTSGMGASSDQPEDGHGSSNPEGRGPQQPAFRLGGSAIPATRVQRIPWGSGLPRTRRTHPVFAQRVGRTPGSGNHPSRCFGRRKEQG